MKNFLKVLGLSVLESVIIIIMLLAIIRSGLPMIGLYIVYGSTAIIFPLTILLVYKRFYGQDSLVVIPLSFILAVVYALGVSLYSYNGYSSFSRMFKELMYFIYFLPSIIYCGVSWIIFAILSRITRDPRRREA